MDHPRRVLDGSNLFPSGIEGNFGTGEPGRLRRLSLLAPVDGAVLANMARLKSFELVVLNPAELCTDNRKLLCWVRVRHVSFGTTMNYVLARRSLISRLVTG